MNNMITPKFLEELPHYEKLQMAGRRKEKIKKDIQEYEFRNTLKDLQNNKKINKWKVIRFVRKKQSDIRQDLKNELSDYRSNIATQRELELEYLQDQGASFEEAEFALRSTYDEGNTKTYHTLIAFQRGFPEYSLTELAYAILQLNGEEQIINSIFVNKELNKEGVKEPLYMTVDNILEENEEELFYVDITGSDTDEIPERVQTFFGQFDNTDLHPDQELNSLVKYFNRDARETDKTVEMDPSKHFSTYKGLVFDKEELRKMGMDITTKI